MEDEQDSDCFFSKREAGRGWVSETSFSQVTKFNKQTPLKSDLWV